MIEKLMSGNHAKRKTSSPGQIHTLQSIALSQGNSSHNSIRGWDRGVKRKATAGTKWNIRMRGSRSRIVSLFSKEKYRKNNIFVWQYCALFKYSWRICWINSRCRSLNILFRFCTSANIARQDPAGGALWIASVVGVLLEEFDSLNQLTPRNS